MSAKLPHYVRVEPWSYSGDADFPPDVKFECPWLYGDCHFYPDCQCEYWDGNHFKENGAGHERVHHDECWMQAWFDAGYGGAVYEGDDADDMQDSGVPNGMNRAGEIITTWEYDYVAWEFKA